MTPEQERQLRIQAGKRGYDRQKVEAFVQFAKDKENTSQPTTAREPEKTNLVKQLAKDAFSTLIVRPGARIGQAAAYGIGALTGNEQIKERAAGNQHVNLGPLGTYDVGTPRAGVQGLKQVAGEAAESASYLYTPTKALTIAKGTFTRSVIESAKQGTKVGAAGGALYGAGREAQRPESSAGSIATEGLKGGAIGAATGAVLTGGVTAAGKVGSKVAVGLRNATQKLTADDSIISRTQRRIEDAFAKRTALKAQPPAVQRAAKVDISPETSHFVMNMSKADKQAARQMVEIAKKAKTTLRPTYRPVELPGRTIIERVKYIDQTRKTAGKQIGEVVKQMPKTRFAPQNATDEFLQGLDNLGVTVAPGAKLNFAKSAITGADEQRLLQQIARDLGVGRPTPGMTNELAHRTRQRIFNMLDLGKQQGKLTSASEVLANKIRSALTNDITANAGKLAKTYTQLSEQYAKSSTALDDFFQLIGRKWSGKSDDLLALRAGEVGNRILGNASANPLDVIARLESTATAYGFKGQNNPVDQLIFNDLLEDWLGSTQTRSLRGQVGRGVSDALTKDAAGIAKDAATGNAPGLLTRAWDYARQIDPDEQLRMLEELLR